MTQEVEQEFELNKLQKNHCFLHCAFWKIQQVCISKFFQMASKFYHMSFMKNKERMQKELIFGVVKVTLLIKFIFGQK